MKSLSVSREAQAAGQIDIYGYEWKMEPPADLTNDHARWLNELSEMRGRVIFDQGQRPAFRKADGTFADPDPVDPFSFHVTARFAGKLVGCARILKFASARTKWTDSLLGTETLERILSGLGSSIQATGESGRWIVNPQHRGKQVGPYLMAGVYAVAGWLELKTILGWSGTHEGQDRAFTSMGWKPVAGFELFPAPQFADELRLMSFDVSHMQRTESHRSCLLAKLLNLP